LNILNSEKLFPLPFNKKDSMFYYIPLFLLTAWIAASILSIFIMGFNNISDGFVIFSIIIRIVIIFLSIVFFKIIFLDNKRSKNIYNVFRAFVGYGVVFTYVFYSLPRMVGEFKENISLGFAIYHFILVIVITLFPAVLYLLLRSDQTRLIMNFFTKKEIDTEKKTKKDKKLKKKEQKRIKSERGIFAYIWYEWVDVIIQAILIAMIIQQFLIQMYQIPSESMVPTFVIKDRVVANKLFYGPHIPLTNWKLPGIKKPNIGDIVVFKNPEMDDPQSEISYKNVFTRIFHPFVYMLTLSLVDIDKKDNGEPKERLLVKRLVAKEGEKICMVNDKVYKKTKNSDWKLMSELAGQREYGQVNLYYENIPNLRSQLITPELREILNESEKIINNGNIEELEASLNNEKENFIKILKKNNLNALSNEFKNLTFNTKHIDTKDDINKNLSYYIGYMQDYRRYAVSSDEVKKHKDYLNKYLKAYHYSILYYMINSLYTYIDKSDYNIDYFNKQISTNIKLNENLNPYDKYMKKLNAVYKIYLMKMFIKLIEAKNHLLILLDDKEKLYESDVYNELHNMYLLCFYTEGNRYINIEENITEYGNLHFGEIFSLRNFSEFPPEKEEYIRNNEYFMLGDNRYNSLDNRYNGKSSKSIIINIEQYFNNKFYNINLDKDDKTDFSKKIFVCWWPRTISIKHVLGSTKLIYWPPDRFKILK